MKTPRRFASAKGFTLIELLIVSAIAMVIFFVGFQLISGTSALSARGYARIRATDSARVFFQMFERDIVAAYPGPFALQKTRTPALDSLGDYNSYDPGLGVLEQTPTKQSDILQFYTRADAPGAPDEHLFVRYYVNRYPDELENTLCRKTMRVFPTDPHPEDEDPLALTAEGEPASPSPNYAIFDHVDNLEVEYFKWKPGTKVFEKQIYPSQDFTHLKVTISMVSKEADKKVFQRFSKFFEIPAEFN
jgi:prepilin-type N-terminal cleavage/methylation domain-containing protein